MKSPIEELEWFFHTECEYWKIIVENKQPKLIVVNGQRIDLISVKWRWLPSYRNIIDQATPRPFWKSIDSRGNLFPLFYVGSDKNRENISHHALFFDTDFTSMPKIFMMNQDGQMSLCFMLIFHPLLTRVLSWRKWNRSSLVLAPGIKWYWGVEKSTWKIMNRFESVTKQKIKKNIIFKKVSCKTTVVWIQLIQRKRFANGKHLVANRFFKAKTKKVKFVTYISQTANCAGPSSSIDFR
jgi:phytoene desaturase